MSDLHPKSVLPTALLVASAHIGAAYGLVHAATPEPLALPLPSVQVSLIAQPAPIPPQPVVKRKSEPKPESKPVTVMEEADLPEPEPVAQAVPAEPEPAPPPVVVEPVYRMASLNNPPPGYPLAARRRGQEGTVVVSAEVLESGTCGNVVIKSSSGHALLDKAAQEAVRRWRFLPARRGLEPIVAWVEVPITFKLDHYAQR